MEDLTTIPLPAIVHLKSEARQSNASHYVVLIGLHPQGVILIDPPTGATLHPYSEFAAEWSGVAIAFPKDRVEESRYLSMLRIREFWSVWPTRFVIAASLGVFAWALFVGKKHHLIRRLPGSNPVGVSS